VRTLSVERLGHRLGSVDSETMDQIVEGLLELIQ
jgi:mRNA-degrading endonuclease toxin of MazEF toxin-antitoxin module